MTSGPERQSSPASRPVVVGRITGVFGVRGWVRVYSYTQPLANVLSYGPWIIGGIRGRTMQVVEGHEHGKGIVARLAGVDDREAARALIGSEISVPRSSFDTVADERYYWTDLLGLEVRNLEGVRLGRVEELLETGANDVLVVTGDRRRLVPFVPDRVVRKVDLAARSMEVDWPEDY